MTDIPSTVTRVVIVDDSSKIVQELFADSWDVLVQDDGRTVKLFARGSGAEAHTKRNAALAVDLQGAAMFAQSFKDRNWL